MKFAIAALLFGASAVVAEHSYYVNGVYDQEGQNRDATCSNNCFSQFFTNKCNSDNPACACTLNDMRDNYLCCVAKNCLDYVAYDSAERTSRDCVAWKLPFPEFDFQAKCNIKISKETTSLPAPPKSSAASSANSGTAAAASVTSAGGDKPASQTSVAAQTSGSDASKTAAASGSDKPSASSSGAAPAATTSAKGAASRVGAGAGAALVGLGAVVGLVL